MKILFLIGAGGFIGSISRYYMSKAVQQWFLSSYPYGTFLVNITGCFLIGFITGIAEKSLWMTPEARLFLTVGICGGFTTFSTFSMEGYNFLRDGQLMQCLVYSMVSVITGLLFVYAGNQLTKLV